MRREHSLLDRLLGSADRAPSRTLGPDEDALVESIVANLSRLLGARHGAAPAQPGYGLPDLAALRRTLDGSNGVIAEVIGQSIKEYEPRLTDVVVSEQEDDEPNPFSLNFTITAYLVSNRERQQFSAVIDSSGNVNVSC